jgi:AraC-like DNA-binding protein
VNHRHPVGDRGRVPGAVHDCPIGPAPSTTTVSSAATAPRSSARTAIDIGSQNAVTAGSRSPPSNTWAAPTAGRAIESICSAWGITNPDHLSRVFRAAYGCPPRLWRARALGGGTPTAERRSP